MNPSGSPAAPSLAERRERLLVRSAELRLQFAEQARVLEAPLAVADTVRDGLRWLRRNPAWPVGTLVALAVLRPRRAWRWLSRGWWAWRLWRRAGRLLAAAQR